MIDVIPDDARWDAFGLAAVAEQAVATTLRGLDLDPARVEVAILGCDDALIATLNADFRGKPTPTNVLSWPEEDLSPDIEGAPPHAPTPDPDGTISLGDIAIAYDTCALEAAGQGKPMRDHVTHLIVHGTLHLLGYDHIRDLDATRMEALEVKLLGIMGVPDPY
ncbi:rRNA maturation RNase YbeY [uncultured Tateyamaria sp.]|uniref:rRNA maturation RNase YbeY n=1 Tax=uncultured Tateyamaria sp. TaxID=455651 RepID=UPI002622FC3D|nr:rRNA maturation RNase YbeY [uncultured Tateyamaria sp.]